MTLVESRTASGEAYRYDEFDDVIVYSPYGVLTFDEVNGACTGSLQPFQAEKLGGVDPSAYVDDMEFSVYMVDESLFMPVEFTDSAKHGSAYVVNGEQLLKIGRTRRLRPDLVGGERSEQKVVEVYTHAFPAGRNVEDEMAAELILLDDLVELFEEQTVEEVRPIK